MTPEEAVLARVASLTAVVAIVGSRVHLDALPARSRISADSLADARAEAGSGRRTGSFREGEGWTEG